MKSTQLIMILLSITFLVWWLMYENPLFFYSSSLFWWCGVMIFLHSKEIDTHKNYKQYWIILLTILLVWYSLEWLFSFAWIPFITILFLFVSYLRAINRKRQDWLWWWEKKFWNNETVFFLSCIACFFVINFLWFSSHHSNYFIWSTFGLLCLLIFSYLLWRNKKSLQYDLLFWCFIFFWLMTWLYALLILVI